eukprot:gene7783-8628_t
MSMINVFAKIRSSLQGENGEKLKLLEEDKNNAAKSGGSGSISPEKFDLVFEGKQKNDELYQEGFGSLIQPFLNGHNVATVLFGESHSGKLSTLLGGDVGNLLKPSSKKGTGMLVLLANDILSSSSEDAGHSHDERPFIKLTVIEIRNNTITDLLAPANDNEANNSSGPPILADNEFEGIIMKNTTQLEVRGAKDCLTLIENTLRSAGIGLTEDSGSNYEDSTLVFQFEMTKMLFGSTLPLRSWFRIFTLPGAEKLLSNPTDTNLQLEHKSNSIVAFGNIIMQLSESITPKSQLPNYRETTLTTLLTDVFGGNCITNCLITFKPFKTATSSTVIRYGLRMKKIINYPIQNTPNSKGLLRRYRWAIKRLQLTFSEDRSFDKALVAELKESNEKLQNELETFKDENAKLTKDNEEMEIKMTEVNRKYADLTSSRTNLSSRMVLSEQEKLKMSKSIVDLQLENNAIKQEAEKQVFDLKRKNVDLKEKLADVERNLALEKRYRQDAKEQATRIKQEYKDLTEEYINLKGNFVSLTDAHQDLVTTNERLIEEINGLAETKGQILQEKNQMEMQQIQEFTSRLKFIAKKISQDVSRSEKVKNGTPTLKLADNERLALEKQLLCNVQEREDKLDSLREEHVYELQKLEEKLDSLKEELKESQDQAERYKMKMAQQNSEILILSEQKHQNEDLSKNLDEQLKEVTQQYCKRLETYVTDLKDFIWSRDGELLDRPTSEKLERVEQMIEGLKKAHNSDADLLKNRINRISTASKDILQRHEKLLTAYKLVLWKTGVGSNGEREIESDFDIPLPPDEEIQMQQMKEKSELKTRLYLAEEHVKELQEKVEKLKLSSKQQTLKLSTSDDVGSEHLTMRSLRKEMRDFTVNVQVELEKERAELITKLTLAEQQLSEYEQYIETYVGRYQREIMHLRKLLAESGHMHSADAGFIHDGHAQRALPPLQDAPRRYAERPRQLRY